MRTRIAFMAALMLLVGSPALATERPEPFHVGQAQQVGRAATTNSMNGLYVSPVDGNVYIATVFGDEITVHDPETGAVLDRIGPERGVHGPDDVFIDYDGNVYWTEILTGHVGKLEPDGTVTRQFVGPGVNPITMSDDGRLFTSQLFLGVGFWELDPDLVAPPTLLSDSLFINSFDFGPDGFLYAPSFFTGEILQIDVDSGFPVTANVVAGGLGVTSAAKFNSAGELHAVNLAAGQVVKVDFSGANAHEVLLDIPGTIDNMAFDISDRIFAAAGGDNVLWRIDRRGITGLTREGFGLPGGVAVSPNGTVWVPEVFSMKGFATNRRPSAAWYDVSLPPGAGFAGATTVHADGHQLILATGVGNAVQVFDPATGAVSLDVRTLGGPTNAIRHGSKVVAGQIFFGNVVNVEDPTDVLIDGLAVPLGLASDGATLYVGDWALGNIWAVDAGGATLLASGLVLPEGMTLDGDRLLVVEPPLGQVTAIDLATGAASPAITGLDYSDRVPDNFFPFGMMAGIDIGPNGSIYVADDGVNKVYEFRR